MRRRASAHRVDKEFLSAAIDPIPVTITITVRTSALAQWQGFVLLLTREQARLQGKLHSRLIPCQSRCVTVKRRRLPVLVQCYLAGFISAACPVIVAEQKVKARSVRIHLLTFLWDHRY